MAFQEGHEKIGGREKGKENKLTQDARKLFIATLEDQVQFVGSAFQHVREEDPQKYLELLAKYAQYFVPKMVDINIGGNVINVVAPDKRKQLNEDNNVDNNQGDI